MLEKLKEEFTKESIKGRLDINTIGDTWNKVKEISGVIWSLSSTALAILSMCSGVSGIVTTIVGGVVTVTGIIYGRARLDKSKIN